MKTPVKSALVGAAILACGLAAAAQAHVTLETREAVAGSYYKATLRVPHGCEGSPTVRLRVRLPEGTLAAKPQPKPGWRVETVKAKLAQPIDNGHGGKITEAVSEVIWSGGNLPDDFYDEFVVFARMPNKPGETVYWPVVQECRKGVHRWIEIPEAGKDPHSYKEPAPALKLLPRS